MANSLVFNGFNLHAEPYTTSEVIAECAGVDRHTVQQQTEKHRKRLEKFGVLAFEMRKPPKGSNGGHPRKVFRYNEEQATLLITFLDNTDVVADFKVELVRQFFAMKRELMKRQLVRESGKQDRLTMTDAIKNSKVIGDEWYNYSNFTKLVYKTALGFTVTQLRKAREANPKAVARDFLTTDELKAVSKRELQATTLIDLGMDYSQIKTLLSGKGVIYQTTLKILVTAQ